MNDLKELERLTNSNIFPNFKTYITAITNQFMNEKHITLEQWKLYGGYTEYDGLDGRTGILFYNEKPFHRFTYNALGTIVWSCSYF